MDFLPDGISFNKDITYLAKTNFRKQEQVFGIKRRDRRQHIYVLGKSGTGKSTLLANMIVQNIWNGEGVCVVDPHGELVESILATIPPHRAKDVVYFNPADTDYYVGFNVLEVDDPRYKHLVASGLMGIFTKIWANVWSSRMEYIMNNAILALIDTPGSTLLGIPRLLVDKDYRQVVVGNLKDPVIKAFWIHEFESWREQFRNEAIAPIQNKVGQFLSTSIVRNVVGQAKSTIDLFDIMNTGKIFLVNVSKGRIGEDNSALLGGMLITKIQLAAMERVRIAEDQRKDFYLYVDEFQNFVTDSFASILSEARKYRLNLTLAHQYIAQLSTKDSDTVRDAVFGNVGTMIIYRVGAVDGEFLEKEFDPEFTPQDMVNLPNFKIYLKLMVDGVTSRPFSATILPPFKVPENSNVQAEIIESSRKLYARPREEVEQEILDWSGMHTGGPGSNNGSDEGKFKAVCSSCGKDAMVPFEPEEGRPVYCKDCIVKIKSGELKPIRGIKPRSMEPQSFASLAGLGIEFPPAPNSVHRPLFKRAVEHVATIVHDPAKRPAQPQQSPYVNPIKKFQPAPIAQSMRAEPVIASKPMSSASSVQRVSAAPAPRTETQKVFRPAPERKGPDHDGLQSILKQALGEALKDSAEFKKEINKEPVESKTKEVKKTISLSSLKKPEVVSNSDSNSQTPKIQEKVASEEKMSALQEAINRAKNSSASNSHTGTQNQTSAPKENPPDGSKIVKEVPEAVLRGVLE